MERMLVVVFDNEKKASEGASALKQLEREGSFSASHCTSAASRWHRGCARAIDGS